MHFFEVVSEHYERLEVQAYTRQLELQIQHGISAELFNLVVQVSSLNRTLGRRMFRAGFRDLVSLCEATIEEIATKGKISEKKAALIYNDAMATKKARQLT